MAIKINVFDANNDGTGIDVDAYFLDFDTNYVAAGFGFFSNDGDDFSGPQYANSEQANLISNPALQSVVFDAGEGASKIEYTGAPSHLIGGDLSSMSFGYGLSYTKATDSFTQAVVDLQISGIGYVDQYGPTNPVRDLINAVRFSDLTDLYAFFNANDIEFTGSSGSDTFTGYAKNDTIIGGDGDDTLSGGGGDDALYGGAGNDTLQGDAGNDTYYYDGKGADVIAAGFVAGAASEDVIKIITGFSDYASLIAATSDDNGDAVIDFGGGNSLRITGVEKADLHEDDFAFGAFGAVPVAADDSGSMVKNLSTVIDVLANDKDSDGTLDPATVTVVDGPDNGTFTIDTTTGKITYTPDADFFGTDTFTYTVEDNDGNVSAEATVTVGVASTHVLTSGNDTFSGDSLGLFTTGIWVDGGAGHDYIVTSNVGAQPDKIYGGEGNDVIYVGKGDDYVEGGAGDDVIHGRAGDDTLIGGEGDDTFVVRMTDAGTTTITDDDGTLFHGTFGPSGHPLAVPATSGFGISGTATVVSPGVYELSVVDNTSVTRLFTLNWTGGDLTITESGKPQTVVIEDYHNGTFGIILPPPAANDDSAEMVKNLSTVIDVLANDKDFDGTLDPATVTVVDGPDNGTFTIDTTTGKITYTPDADFFGTDTFTYTVEDNDGNVSPEATVTIEVASTHVLTSGNDTFSGDSLGLFTTGIWVDGGAGHDYIVTSNVGSQPDKIYGGDGNDVIFVGKGDDYVEGGAGDDVIHGRAGNDTLIGGEGDDTYVVRMTDAGTTTITDDDGTLFHGTFQPSGHPLSTPATSGFEISGEATLVSPGVYELSLVDNTSTTRTFTLNWTGGDLTITESGKPQTIVIEDYLNGKFGIELPMPIVNHDTASTVKDLSTVIDVLANDRDIDGTLDPATVTVVDGPDNGTFTIDPLTGKITYTPTTGFYGTDTFTYTVEDNDGNVSTETTVTIDVASTHVLTDGDDVFSGDSLGLTKSGIWVEGGKGNDYIVTSNVGSQPDKIYGGDGNDLIFVGKGDDYVDGGGGNDVIHGRAGNDTLIGGEGHDTFVVRMTDAGTTTIQDTSGVLFHGTFAPESYPSSWGTLNPSNGFEISGTAESLGGGVYELELVDNTSTTRTFTLNWTGGDLTITETGKPQTIVIEDFVNGTFGLNLGIGNTINGTAKNDTIDGSYTPPATVEADIINGLGGNDIIDGLGGADKINGGAGKDTINGGAGDDIIYVSGNEGQTDVMDGGDGHDTLEAIGTKAVTLGGFAGNNSIEAIVGNGLQIIGTKAADTFDFSNVNTISNVTYFDGGAGNDTFKTGNGVHAEYRGGAGNDTFIGGNGNDTFRGDAGVDNLDGGDGDDTLVISGTNDTTDVLKGGNGTDTILVDGTKTVTLAAFDATAQSIEVWTGNGQALIGTKAGDTFDFTGLTAVTGLPFVSGGAGNDTLIGSDSVGLELRGDAGDDTLSAGAAGATLIGGAGKDTLTGGAGDDTLVISGTGDATDILNGNGGTDTIRVDGKTAVTLAALDTVAGSIEVWTGNGQALVGTSADNTIDLSNLTTVSGLTFVDGGAGNDTITGSDAWKGDLRGGAGDDVITAGNAGDTLNGGAGNNTLIGGTGDDTFIGGAGADAMTGGGGNDTVSYAASKAAVTVNLRTGFATGGDATGDKLTGINNVIGSKGNDTLTASAAGSVLDGGAGTDVLLGGLGDDTFIISGKNDTNDFRDGNAGNDTVKIVGSNAVLNGFVGAYEDVENFDGNGFGVIGTTAANTFDFTGVNVTGLTSVDAGAGNDTLIAGADGLRLIGGAGVDTVLGGAGDDTIVISGKNDTTDTINGGGGNDTIEVTGKGAVTLAGFDAAAQEIEVWQGNNAQVAGTNANETFDFSGLTTVTGLTYVDGGGGNDTIIGSDAWAGDLRGGAGNDTLQGGSQNDTLTGGAGADTFVFTQGGGQDIVTDLKFANASTVNATLDDKIDLTDFGFNNYGEVQALMTQDGKNVVIDFGGGDTLQLNNVTLAALDAHEANFLL